MEPTKDHKTIRNWARTRRAIPASTRGYADGVPAVLSFIIPGANWHNRNLDAVTWEDFFAKFDLLDLAFVFQEITSTGEKSTLNEILQRETPIQDHRNWH